MSFRLEAEMTAPAAAWLSSLGLLVKCEYATPWGVCDLVGLRFREDKVAERLELGQRRPIGPPLRIELLDRIPDEQTGTAVRLTTLQREFGSFLSGERLRLEIERLISAGFATMPRRGHLQKINGWAPLNERIVTLELKLSRIEEALAQASSHVAFADESYVGLPRETAERVCDGPRRAVFVNHGVGIVAIGKGACEVLQPAGSSSVETDPILQAHCVERFWRSRF